MLRTKWGWAFQCHFPKYLLYPISSENPSPACQFDIKSLENRSKNLKMHQWTHAFLQLTGKLVVPFFLAWNDIAPSFCSWGSGAVWAPHAGSWGASQGKKLYFRPSRHLETAHFQHLEIAIPALPTSHYVVSMKMILILHL